MRIQPRFGDCTDCRFAVGEALGRTDYFNGSICGVHVKEMDIVIILEVLIAGNVASRY